MFGFDLPIVILICGVLCIGGLVIGVAFTLLDFVFDILGTVIGLAVDLIEVGPIPGCGCVMLAGLLFGCVLFGTWFVDAMATCGTAEAVNLCRLF